MKYIWDGSICTVPASLGELGPSARDVDEKCGDRERKAKNAELIICIRISDRER